MGQAITLTGMVLSAAPVGEFDRRIVLLTREKGKISAFARGARRPGNALVAASSPFSFGQFEAYEGRSSYTVVKADIANYFRELAGDLDGAYYGFYFLEVAEYYTRENMEGLWMLKLLYQSLRALESKSLDNRLVRRIFELKAMTVNGESPNVFSCLKCGRKEDLRYFHVQTGGTLCGACGCKAHAQSMDGSTLYTLQYIISAPIEKLYTFQVSPKVLQELGQILDAYMAYYMDRQFQSLQVLKENQGFARQFAHGQTCAGGTSVHAAGENQ